MIGIRERFNLRSLVYESCLALMGGILLPFLSPFTAHLTPAFGAVEMPYKSYLEGLTWLGHASFRLERGGKVVYFDPWRIAGEPHDADVVLITHPHFDHLEPADVAKVMKEGTLIVTVAEALPKLAENGVTGTVKVVKPGDVVKLDALTLEVVPAYNTDKAFHPKENEWVGFIVEIGGVRIYHAGDTDRIPEMEGLKTDVALLPVSGTYVMTAEEAAASAQAIKPAVAVPMHYGSIVGVEADAKRFKELCGSVVAEILEREK